MLRAVRRAEIMELVDVVLNTGYSQDRVCHQGGSHAADRKAVRPRVSVNVIGGLSPSPCCHILDDQNRVSGNMLA